MGITYMVTLYSDSRGVKESRAIPVEVSKRLLALKRKYKEFVSLRGYVGKFSEAVEQGGVGPCFAGKNLCNIDSDGNVSLCIDLLDDPVGNIMTDDIFEIERKLNQKYEENKCTDCWTSCRGSIESIRHGGEFFGNLIDYYQMVRPIRLA